MIRNINEEERINVEYRIEEEKNYQVLRARYGGLLGNRAIEISVK